RSLRSRSASTCRSGAAVTARDASSATLVSGCRGAGIRPHDVHVLPDLQLHPPRHQDGHRLHVGRRPPVVDLHVHADHPEHLAPHPHHPSPPRQGLHRVLLVFPHKRSPGPQVLPDAHAAFSSRSRAGRKRLLWGLSNIPGCTRIAQLSPGSGSASCSPSLPWSAARPRPPSIPSLRPPTGRTSSSCSPTTCPGTWSATCRTWWPSSRPERPCPATTWWTRCAVRPARPSSPAS